MLQKNLQRMETIPLWHCESNIYHNLSFSFKQMQWALYKGCFNWMQIVYMAVVNVDVDTFVA